jgi:hypothetical protein
VGTKRAQLRLSLSVPLVHISVDEYSPSEEGVVVQALTAAMSPAPASVVLGFFFFIAVKWIYRITDSRREELPLAKSFAKTFVSGGALSRC